MIRLKGSILLFCFINFVIVIFGANDLLDLMTTPKNSNLEENTSIQQSSGGSFTPEQLDDRIYQLNQVFAAGCPYTATWLIHLNLFLKSKVWLDSTKMEAASFIIYGYAQHKFQVVDSDAYFVHHMSRYEHLLHKKDGFEIAKNKTLIMTKAAYNGECKNLKVADRRDILAIVPFYGGLPPNVTKDLSVKSIGQGNSLVDAGTKALQCMTMLCSLLRYYGQVALGVTRAEDKDLMIRLIDETNNPSIKERVHIVQFAMKKPANLPFHLMAWAQNYIKWYNCEGSKIFPHPRAFKPQEQPITDTNHANTTIRRLAGKHAKRLDVETNRNHHSDVPHSGPSGKHHKTSKLSALAYSDRLYAAPDIYSNDSEVFKICSINFNRHHIGGPLDKIYHRRSLIHRHGNEAHPRNMSDHETYNNDPFFKLDFKTTWYEPKGQKSNNRYRVPINYWHPIRYVYYSECDQTVHYDSMTTFEALLAATNDTTFFTGKRREKDADTAPEDYLGGLIHYRECGVKGYTLRWPKEHVVRLTD